MTTQSIEGAMPPLPEPDHKFVDMEDEDPDILVWRAEKMHAYAKAYAAPLLARVAKLQAERDNLRNLLQELNALVWGECRSLLDEDSGGNSALALEIDAALAAHKEQP